MSNDAKITFSSGRVAIVRKPTMHDYKLATENIKNVQDGIMFGQRLSEELAGLILQQLLDDKGNPIKLGIKPIPVKNFFSLQEFMEFNQACEENGIIIDNKKKATVEFIPQSSPQNTQT